MPDAKWTTEFIASARRDLRRIARRDALRILHKLTELEADPLGLDTTELVDEPGLRRLRVGDYRVIYTLDGGRIVIVVVAVGHRAQIYDHLHDRLERR